MSPPDPSDEARALARLDGVRRRAGELRWRRALTAAAAAVAAAVVALVVGLAVSSGSTGPHQRVTAGVPGSTSTTTTSSTTVAVPVTVKKAKVDTGVPVAKATQLPTTTAAVATPVPVASTTTSTTIPATTTAAPPPPLAVGSVSALTPAQWWVLGSAQACAGTLCLAHTTDGGASYTVTAGPRTSFGGPTGGAVSHLLFVTSEDGYAWGPGLWVTTDGGAEWGELVTASPVEQLVAGATDGAAFALRGCPPAPPAGCTPTVYRYTPGPTSVVPVQLSSPAGPPTSVAAAGGTVWVAAGSTLERYTDSVDPTTQVDPACPPPGGTLGTLAASSGSDLYALCPGGADDTVVASGDGGTTAFTTGSRPTVPADVQPSAPLAAGGSTVCTFTDGGVALCSEGAGQAFSALSGSTGGPLDQITFAPGTDAGFAVAGPSASGRLYRFGPGGTLAAAPVPATTGD